MVNRKRFAELNKDYKKLRKSLPAFRSLDASGGQMIPSRWILLMSIACALSAIGQAPASPKTVTEVLDRSISGPERATLALAEKMPESSYNFAPTRGEFKGVSVHLLNWPNILRSTIT